MTITFVDHTDLPSIADGGSFQVHTLPVEGGSIYFGISRSSAGPVGVGAVFVPTNARAARQPALPGSGGGAGSGSGGGGPAPKPVELPLASAKAPDGSLLPPAAGNGVMSYQGGLLVGEEAHETTNCDHAVFEFGLPETYEAGEPVKIDIDADIAGGGVVTIADCVVKLGATKTDDDTDLTVTPPEQQIDSTGGVLAFEIDGADLEPGDTVRIEIQVQIVCTQRSATGQISAVSYTA
jgi:hypothetical protein